MKSPNIEPEGDVSCACQCDAGWMTDLDQPFESFEYCGVQTGVNSTDTPAPSQSAANWRPPIYPSPPPPPKTYKDESGTSLPLFKWAIIGASIVVGGTQSHAMSFMEEILTKGFSMQPLLSSLYAKLAAVVPAEDPVAVLLLLLQQDLPTMAFQHTLLLNIYHLLISTPININLLHSDTNPSHIVLLPKAIPRKTSPSITMLVNK